MGTLICLEAETYNALSNYSISDLSDINSVMEFNPKDRMNALEIESIVDVSEKQNNQNR